jgi:hypothetical protein
MLNLTKTYANVYNQKRKLFYGNNITLKCLKGNKVLIELFDNWFLGTRAINNLALGLEYYELDIADISNNLSEILKTIDRFEIAGIRYKKEVGSEKPLLGTKVWRFRIAPTGEIYDS